MPLNRGWIGVVLAVAFAPLTARGQDLRPLPTFNQSPLVQIYGLPALGNATVLGAHRSEVQLTAALANNFTSGIHGSESLTLDGETHRVTLGLRRGLGDGYEVGAEIPYVRQTGGFLDHTIESWHHLFGLPNAGREFVPRDRLIYRYARGSQTLIDVENPSSGIGDVRLTGARRLGPASALRLSIKLPTGEASALRGSGATDVALWVSTACRDCGRLGWYGGGGALWLGRGVLSEVQRRWVGFGTVGASWAMRPALALKVQVDAHTPFYRDSQLVQLSSVAAQLLLGGTWTVSRRSALDIAVSEDAVVTTSPDVVFYLGWRTRL